MNVTNSVRKKLSESRSARWVVVALTSFTMMCGYFLTDVMAPLQTLLENQLQWSSTDYGIFTSSYGWLNIFAFMLIISGIVLDKMGVRFTGIGATLIMIVGASIKYFALSSGLDTTTVTLSIGSWHIITLSKQVLLASVGYTIFGVGVETIGITVSKAIVRWFKGKEMALALGLNVATGRIGTLLALAVSPIIAKTMGDPSKPILLCLLLLSIGLLSFICFCVLDKRLEKEGEAANIEKEDFKFSALFNILGNRAFWYIAILCVLFYSGVFPFLKYASNLMVNKFGLSADVAGLIPSILPFGTLILTPFFGNLYDRKGKGATIMIIGSVMLMCVHLLFATPWLNNWIFAAVLMVFLGIAFSLVPSAMWPSLAKIVHQNQLGTAYALTFWIQNWGLSGVPLLIGWVLDKYCILPDGSKDYTLPMLIFASFGAMAIFISLLLKKEDAKRNYGLENKNKEI